MPSLEAAYPWFLALARDQPLQRPGHQPGASAARRHCAGGGFLDGALIAVAPAPRCRRRSSPAPRSPTSWPSATTVPASSRFGPTAIDGEPPLCAGPLTAGLDRPPVGGPERRPSTSDRSAPSTSRATRSGTDFRWIAYVATRSAARAGGRRARSATAPGRASPGRPWAPSPCNVVGDADGRPAGPRDGAGRGNRATAEDRGVEVIEGARARRCRVAVDGTTFQAAFPQVRWLVGDADLAPLARRARLLDLHGRRAGPGRRRHQRGGAAASIRMAHPRRRSTSS